MHFKKQIKKLLALISATAILLSNIACSAQLETGIEEQTTDIVVKDDHDNLNKSIDAIQNAWNNGEINSDVAISRLEKFLSNENTEIVALVTKMINYIRIETSSNNLLIQAQTSFDTSDYISSIKAILQIDNSYSKYSDASSLLELCKNAIINEVSTPSTIAEYEHCIALLDEYLNIIEDEAMSLRKTELTEELIILKDIANITERAAKLYDNQKYKEAFFTLAQGLDKYPGNETLESNLIDFHDHYIIQITQLVNIQCRDENYKEALKIIESALLEYNCEEFILLQESVKEQRNPLYKIKNDVVSKFKVAAQGWESEDLDVRQLANDAGTYVVKSGKQLLLGDYSGENVTILSFSGNMVASIAGIDTLLDIRDLSYEIVHWGEEEYFALYLAADVLALLPVIGVIKYYDHFKDATKLAESVGDVIKNSDVITDAADEVATVLKHTDDIAEAAAGMKYISKISDNGQILKNISKGYDLVPTRNAELLGKTHPVTGVTFVLSEVSYSNGQKLIGVFPVFKSYADIELKPQYFKVTFAEQETQCLIELQKETKHILGKYWKNFTKEERALIQNGILPEGYTWHHSETEGLMQLVKTNIHKATGHTGGMSLWGLGY